MKFQGGTSFVDLLCFCSVLCLLCFVCVCLYMLCGLLLGKGWPLGSRLWCLLWVCPFPIGILGQVWYLIVSIPDLCTLTYFQYRVHPGYEDTNCSLLPIARIEKNYCVDELAVLGLYWGTWYFVGFIMHQLIFIACFDGQSPKSIF